MIKVMNFKPEHIKDITLKDIYTDENHLETIVAIRNSHVQTLTSDGKPIAIVGMTKICKGVAEFWGLIGKEVKKVPHGFHRTILGIVAHLEKEMVLHRIQIIVLFEYAEGRKWVEKLGFKPESVLQKYDSLGRNYIMYVRLN